LNHTSGSGNNAFGHGALGNLTSGNGNTALGEVAGLSLQTGSGNIYIGDGIVGASTEDNHTYIRNIGGTVVSGSNVTVNLSTGLLGHAASSRRYKEHIKPMAKASEALYRLKPVTYRYNKEIDPGQALDYGLVAEEVADIDPNLTACNSEGQVESVRYNAINAMLLNEFLKEHRKVQEQEATIARLEKEVETVVARLKQQDAKIQRVSDQIQLSKRARQVVVNDP
jgi:hypothetical protein